MTSAVLITWLKERFLFLFLFFINDLNLEALKKKIFPESISGWRVSPKAAFWQETLKKQIELERKRLVDQVPLG